MPREKEEDKKNEGVSVGDATGDEILEAVKEQRAITVKRLDKSDAELSSMSDRLTDQATLIKSLEERTKTRNFSLPGVDLEKENFSFIRAINAIKTGDWAIAGHEKEIFANTRAMSAGTGSEGGYIVPAEAITKVIEMLRANMVVIKMGATILDNLAGSPVFIPKQTGGATAFWVGENEDITDSDLAMGQIELRPHAVAAMVKLSNRLLEQSNPAVEAMIKSDMALALGLAIDYAALRGSGAQHQPVGIANTAGIKTVAIGADGGDFTLDHVLDMQSELASVNALSGKLGYISHPIVIGKLKKQRIPQYSGDTSGAPFILPMSDSKLKDVLGYTMSSTTQIPTNLEKGSGRDMSEVYFGNWTELFIAQWGGLEIMASSETSDAFAKNQTWIRIIQEVDIGVRHAESFCLINDAATT